MTTVVYYKGVLYSDSRLSAEGQVYSDVFRKIGKTEQYLYGVCGEGVICHAFLEWASTDFNPALKPDTAPFGDDPSFEGVAINVDGGVTYYSERFLPLYMGKIDVHAIGSGSEYARGALEAGVDPKRAIEIAAMLDSNTGGAIVSVAFKKTKSNNG